MKNIIIVGCGCSGAILSRKIAEELDCPVQIVERRPHIAGNMYDEYDEHGILIQKYGPHHFYTNNYNVFTFWEQYGELFTHYYKCKNLVDGRYITRPFNFLTIQELMGREKAAKIIPEMRRVFEGRQRVPVIELLECKNSIISEYGNVLFDKCFRPYIQKMWDIPLEKIDRYVLGRRAMAMGYDERDADYDFQGLPKNGWTKCFEKLLDHRNIRVKLNTDALEHISFENNHVLYDNEFVDCLIFTGPIDELFQFKYGKLPYRSLDIRWNHYDSDSVLPAEGISYPQAIGYVRETEYRKMMFDTSGIQGSTVSTEYPLEYCRESDIGNEPYYPVITKESLEIYRQYEVESRRYGNIFLCGRLAEFRYIDIHTCVEHALEYFKNIKTYLTRV